jgi:hypothetical protein
MRVVMAVVNVEISVEMVMLKELDLLVIFPTTKPIALHPPNNQSKPIVSTPSLSLL